MLNTITIGKITIGGSAGAYPTALAGSVFYDKHNIVKDHASGDFDAEEAARLIAEQDAWSEKTGIPAMVDIVASTTVAMRRYIEFVAEQTQAPFLIDGSHAEVRLAGVTAAKELGVMDRAIYNSISVHSEAEELKHLKQAGCLTAVLLAYNPVDFSMKGRLDVVQKLLNKASEAGIEQAIVDTSVIDVPSLGMAKELISVIKEKYGIAVGNSPHNAISRWPGLKSKFPQAKESCTVVAHAAAAAWGADFLIYGPIRHAGVIFPSVGLVQACFGQLKLERGQMIGMENPLFKMA